MPGQAYGEERKRELLTVVWRVRGILSPSKQKAESTRL